MAQSPAPPFSSEEFISLTATLEGRLFPDTYLLPTAASASDIIRLLSTTFDQQVKTIDQNTLILASS